MIYITGDTHGEFNKLSYKNFTEGKNLTKNDYVIICGDFGLLFNYENIGNINPNTPNDPYYNEKELYWYNWLCTRPFTVLFVDGNHENFNRLNTYPIIEWNEGKIHKISDNIFHLMRGEVYTINGKKFFTFGGARSIDRGEAVGKEERDINKTWWKEELPNQIEIDNAVKNLEKHNNKVDYIITHAMPNNMLMRKGYNEFDILTSFLWNIYDTTEFSEWYCGHYHVDEWISYNMRILYNDIELVHI